MARPQIQLDAELVRELARAQLTTHEIAVICKCSPDTIERRFAATLKEWKDEGVGSVRRELFSTAIGNSKGKVPAMIFFLKNYGGMSDRLEHSGTVKTGIDPEQLSDADLAQVESIVESAQSRIDSE